MTRCPNKSTPNFSKSCPIIGLSRFCLKGAHFQSSQKSCKVIGLLNLQTFITILFKNSPIWSHWLRHKQAHISLLVLLLLFVPSSYKMRENFLFSQTWMLSRCTGGSSDIFQHQQDVISKHFYSQQICLIYTLASVMSPMKESELFPQSVVVIESSQRKYFLFCSIILKIISNVWRLFWTQNYY